MLPIDVDDAVGIFQAVFKVTGFKYEAHGECGRPAPELHLNDSLAVSLISQDGKPCTALLFCSEDGIEAGFVEERNRINIVTDSSTVNKFLKLIMGVAACNSAKLTLGIQYDKNRVVDMFWFSLEGDIAIGLDSVH